MRPNWPIARILRWISSLVQTLTHRHLPIFIYSRAIKKEREHSMAIKWMRLGTRLSNLVIVFAWICMLDPFKLSYVITAFIIITISIIQCGSSSNPKGRMCLPPYIFYAIKITLNSLSRLCIPWEWMCHFERQQLWKLYHHHHHRHGRTTIHAHSSIGYSFRWTWTTSDLEAIRWNLISWHNRKWTDIIFFTQ